MQAFLLPLENYPQMRVIPTYHTPTQSRAVAPPHLRSLNVAVLLQRQDKANLREMSAITRDVQRKGIKLNTSFYCKILFSTFFG